MAERGEVPGALTIRLWGETLCLDYANSVNWSPEDVQVERAKPVKWVRTTEETDMLRTGDVLGRWGRRLGLLGDDAKSASAAELRRARALRDAVYRLFASISHEQDPSTEHISLLMHNYTEAVNRATLLASGVCYQLDWPAQDPRRVRYAVATDAIELLRDPERLGRVSRCPGRDCGWLFLNLSGRRRWCSMSTCGSREKMRRLYQRRRQHAD
jgi:predicted RNA-binding Zn ribbon-like protein